MASYNKNWWDGSCSYCDDPCLYCGGPHSWQNCLNFPGGGLCAQSQTHEWSIRDKCGFQNGHWDDCVDWSFPSPSPRYDDSIVFDENDRANELEEVEHGRKGEFKLMLECLLEGGNKEQSALEELLENSLQNSLALNQNQELSNAQNEKIMLMLETILENEEECELKFEESRIEPPPTDPMSTNDAEKNMDLESTGVNKNLVENDSSLGEEEDVRIEKLQNEGLKSHSKHFSTLELCSDIKIELHESVRDCEEERQQPYILQFEETKNQNDIPHMRPKKCKMKNLRLGSIINLPPLSLVVKTLIPS